MKKKLLIASGGYADIAIIQSAKKLGFFVITSGLDENGLGNQYSDLYCKADNSNKEEITAIAKKLKVDAVCPGAAGLCAVSCSYAAEQLGFECLDSYSTSKVLHYKDNFGEFARKNNLLVPKAKSFSDINTANNSIDEFNFPLIVKPSDLSGGKGISKAVNKAEAKVAILNAFNRSRAKTIVIQEFIDGSNHGFSAIIRDDKVVFHFCDNEYYYLNKYNVAGASAPGNVSEDVIDVFILEIEKISAILKLKDGIFHSQFILKDNKPYLLEVCRRVPGDLYVNFVKYATGVDYPSFIVKAFAGMDIKDLAQKSPDSYYTRHVIMGYKEGIFKNVIFDESIKDNVIDEFMIINEGDEIKDVMTQRVGIVFLRYDSREEIDEKNAKIHELIRVKIKN